MSRPKLDEFDMMLAQEVLLKLDEMEKVISVSDKVLKGLKD